MVLDLGEPYRVIDMTVSLAATTGETSNRLPNRLYVVSAEDKSSTTADGVASGALIGGIFTWSLATAVCAGSMGTACVPAYGVAAGSSVAGGVIGGVAAADSATDTEGYEQQTEQAAGHIERLDIQKSLAASVTQAARKHSRVEIVANNAADIRVTTAVDRILIDELGNMRVIGRLELVDPIQGDEPELHDFDFLITDAKKPADWVANDGIAIDHALGRALLPIGDRLVNELATLVPEIPPLVLSAVQPDSARLPSRWQLGWHSEDAEAVPAATGQVQVRVYPPNTGDACLDWLRREHYTDPSVCLPAAVGEGDTMERSEELQAAAIGFDASGCGEHSWIARQVWPTAEGQRTSDWTQGPRFGTPCDATQSDLNTEPEPASIKVKRKMQFRVLWANRVDCYLYEPDEHSTHTRMVQTLEREVSPGRQVIGGICTRDHGNLLLLGTTPWTENEVSFWLEGDLLPGRRYRIGLAELKRNLSFRCVTLIDRESNQELDRFCIPAPADNLEE